MGAASYILVHHVTPARTMVEIFDRATLVRLGRVYGPSGAVWSYLARCYRNAYMLSTARTTDADIAGSHDLASFGPGDGPAEGLRVAID